ncbi:hypothetical protein SE17_02760 [Kouleothrix aurantiaca]|uniref:Uncharacterized protein n=1 Tax=Kouleothrix aurantiaca TaxID=186479 RepID=A0A0P9DAC2_9CHLR|nr:hypothetical protein SE17_02760 [Kouleothrix aurantiaca]
MSADIPQPVQQVLNAYISLVNDALPGLLAGLYLHGSLALGAYNPGLSDIDFIAITSRRCTPSDIDTLRVVHHMLIERYPQAQLEGSYLQWHDLGRSEDTIPPHPHIHDGIVHASGYHDINAVTWWVLKHRGIAVLGPSPHHFAIQVDLDDLLGRMHHNLNTYWVRFTTEPRRMAWLLDDYGIQWAVLGVLRQFYTFRERAITSKTAAGMYALAYTPRQWHQLIQEAVNIRMGSRASLYRSRIVRAIEARAFLQLIIAACKKVDGS